MGRDTVLVIGAGASHGARTNEPRERRPPFGKDLAGYLLGWYDENAPKVEHFDPWNVAMEDETDETAPSDDLYQFAAEVRAALAEAVDLCSSDNPLGFEQVMAKLLLEGEEKRHVLTKVNSVIAVSFLGGKTCLLGRADDAYDRLLGRIKDRLHSVITPNYDLLCEEALDRVGLTFRYSGDVGAQGQVVVYKFHGSANFFQSPGSSGSASEDIARRGVKPLTATEQKNLLSFSNDHPLGVSYPRENAFLEHKHKGAASYPVMVTYGPGKDATDGRRYLDEIRRACGDDLRQEVPARIIALGVSPPRGDGDDDAWEGLCDVFNSLDCAKEYWSKVDHERKKMARYGFEGRDGYFDELLDALDREIDLTGLRQTVR